jgi:hypothetical protein
MSWDMYGEYVKLVCVLPEVDGAAVFPKINIRKKSICTYTSGQLVKKTPDFQGFVRELGSFKATIRTTDGQSWDIEFDEQKYFFEFINALDEALMS